MNPCQNCGKLNTDGTNFCRFCGTKLPSPQQEYQLQPQSAAPRPYAWKTDEFQTQNEARRTGPVVGGLQGSGSRATGLVNMSQGIDAGYRCSKCGSTYFPVLERRISTAGWIVFSVLLITTVIFFWIGLLMKEEVAICPVCRSKAT
ncbi:MAG: zinc ribbon domain-containing protein [Pyrinomonadaceae bacterium]